MKSIDEQMKGIMTRTVRICPQCKTQNIIKASIVKKEKFQLVGGNSIQIMYYECPICQRINILQLDNATTLETLEEVRTMFVKAMKLKESSKHRGQLKKRFEKRREMLRMQRQALAETCNGMVAINDHISITIESGDLYDV